MSKCKHGRECCGEYFDCGLCERQNRARAYQQLTPEQKAYDRFVDPLCAYHTDFPAGCSCHINPPCSFCVDSSNEKSNEDE